MCQKLNGPWLSYLGGRWPIMSRWSLLFLVQISLIFMSGRGLEVISPNVRSSSTVSPILFKPDLMTWIESGVHVLVVHYCISLIIHRLKEHSHFYQKWFVTTVSQKPNGRWLSYLGGRWPIMSRWSLLFLVRISLIFISGWGLEVISPNVWARQP